MVTQSRRTPRWPHRSLLHWQLAALLVILVFTAHAGCASMEGAHEQRQVASMLNFLFP